MEPGEAPLGLPGFLHITAYFAEERSSVLRNGVLKKIRNEHGQRCKEASGWLAVPLDGVMCRIKSMEEDDCLVFLVAVFPLNPRKRVKDALEDVGKLRDLIRRVIELLPQNPLSTFTVSSVLVRNEEEALNILRGYLQSVRGSIRSLGIVRSCLVASLAESQRSDRPGLLRRDLVILPFNYELEEADSVLQRLSSDVVSLAVKSGRLNDLCVARGPVLRSIDSSEKSTQLKINQIFSNMRRPVGQVKVDDLETALSEVTIIFSDLSMISSAMRRDNVKAESIHRDIRGIYDRWGEGDLEAHPSNTAVELDAYASMISPFRDFIDRVEALRTQLETVLDAIRTYLGIQQQRLGVAEEKSSKELLLRLLNLQEIMHKLEILIVAFYITEMASLVFEVTAHEMAHLLTAIFIPLALLIAIFISRFFHK